MLTNQNPQIPAARKRFPLLPCGCLFFLIFVLMCVIFPNTLPNLLAQYQASQAADSYMAGIKAEKHIQSWNFTSHSITQWTGDGLSGGNKADFSGVVIYEDGQSGPLSMTLRDDGFMNFLHENWRIDKVDFGSDTSPTATP
ncbi:MAG TPA: hypothetical protein VKQ72_05335 [Aggregatilineales bacterium]|nr:hypothetical protein [Aggregatilineales bacterium]